MANPQGWLHWSSHLACNGWTQWLILLIWRASRQGSQARLRSATAVRLQYSDVIHAPFLPVTTWILYIVVPSHTINLPRVCMSLTSLQTTLAVNIPDALQRYHSWSSWKTQTCKKERLHYAERYTLWSHACHLIVSIHVCALMCLCGCCMQNGGLLSGTLCCNWNTATNTAKVRAEWFNNLSRWFG